MKRRICISSDGDDDDDHSMPSLGGKDNTKSDTLLEKLIDSVLMMNGKMERLIDRVDTLDKKVNQVMSELVKLKKSRQEKKQTVFVQKSVETLWYSFDSSSEGWRPRGTQLDAQQRSNLKRRKTVDTEGEAEEPKQQGSEKSSAQKKASRKSESKKTTAPKIATPVSSAKKHATRSTSKHSKESIGVCTPVAFSFSEKEKDAKTSQRNYSSPPKSATNVTISKKKAGKKLVQRKDEQTKGLNPSEDDLRCTIAEILREVDFNKETFTDILRKIGGHYDVDLTPRKEEVKLIIQEELTRLADEGETDEEDESKSEVEDAPKPAAKRIKT